MRIASLLSSATEMVCGLGLEDSLVAISHECDYPTSILDRPRVTRSLVDSSRDSLTIDVEVKARLRQGLPLYAIDEPKLAALQPDLILTQSQCDVCAIRLEDVHAFVRSRPALQRTKILGLSPQSLADVLADVASIANAAGVEEQGAEYVRQLQARVNQIEQGAQQSLHGKRPRVLCVEWTDPLMAAGNWTPELINRAGGESCLAEAEKHSPYITWEQVKECDADLLLFAPCGFRLKRSEEEVRRLASKYPLHELRAVQSGHAYVVDGNALFNRSGPRLVETLAILAKLIAGSDETLEESPALPNPWYQRLVV